MSPSVPPSPSHEVHTAADASASASANATAGSPPNSQQDPDSSFADSSLQSLSQSDNGHDVDTSQVASDAGDQKHPRAKRKRTNAEDKMILEDAYMSNPKPDKQARLDLVQRVSLNEKEVQIWFQNRRQNDRRKSRPLSHLELTTLRSHNIKLAPDDSAHQSVLKVINGAYVVNDPVHGFPSSSSPPQQHQISPASLQPSPPGWSNVTPSHSHTHSRSFSDATSFQHSQDRMSQDSYAAAQGLSSSFPGVGYLANRWNKPGGSFSTPSSQTTGRYDDFSFSQPEGVPRSSSASNTPESTNSSSSQHPRMSFSLDGKAEIISNDISPTRLPPPKPFLGAPPQRESITLQRSQSGPSGITLPPISSLTSGIPPRLHRGRSHNVQAWESCAGAETRDQLTTVAERESDGNALASIALLRSASSSNVLQPSSATKRNAPLSKTQRINQRQQGAKRAKISRTQSSIAKFDTTPVQDQTPSEKLLKPSDNKDKAAVMAVSPTDSDKENWNPDENDENDPDRRRPLPSAPFKSQNPRRRGNLMDVKHKTSLLGSRANTAPARRRRQEKDVEIFEDDDDDQPGDAPQDDEVERFMRGTVSPSKKGDMDCVQSLLSLKKGEWR